MNFDLIVIGAGPAGSTAARTAASRGLKVLLLDKASFPRDKLCAGGLTAKALPLLPQGTLKLSMNAVSQCRISFRDTGRTCLASSPQPCVYMFERRDLDYHLLQTAIAAGAVFRDSTRVVAVDQESGRIETVSGKTNEVLKAPWIIAADGPNSIARRQLLPDDRYCQALCLETVVPWERIDQSIIFNFGSVPDGYGWIFPKGDHASVGIGTSRRHAGRIRSYYRNFLEIENLAYSAAHGFPLAVFSGNKRLTKGRVLFCGDAAHLVDPITGEGLYQAMFSGAAAGQAVTGANPAQTYERAIANNLLGDLKKAATLGRFISGLPAPSFAALEASPKIAAAYIDVISGRKSYAQLMGSGLQGPFRIIGHWIRSGLKPKA